MPECMHLRVRYDERCYAMPCVRHACSAIESAEESFSFLDDHYEPKVLEMLELDVLDDTFADPGCKLELDPSATCFSSHCPSGFLSEAENPVGPGDGIDGPCTSNHASNGVHGKHAKQHVLKKKKKRCFSRTAVTIMQVRQ